MWCWDAFQLADVTQDHALSTLAFYLFRETGLVQEFKINEVKLARFFRKVRPTLNHDLNHENETPVLSLALRLAVHQKICKWASANV